MKPLLLIEDNEDLGDILCSHLQDLGLTVLWAKTAAEAHQLIQANPFLVVSDIHLNATQTGIDLCRDFRGQGIKIPFLFITGVPSPEYETIGRFLGKAKFMYKPFSLEDLRAALGLTQIEVAA